MKVSTIELEKDTGGKERNPLDPRATQFRPQTRQALEETGRITVADKISQKMVEAPPGKTSLGTPYGVLWEKRWKAVLGQGKRGECPSGAALRSSTPRGKKENQVWGFSKSVKIYVCYWAKYWTDFITYSW